ncbi:hypothetical protein [Streptomyces ficellus]|uniref:LppX_LprAFG lipoprotein n=1 Tax=Streptomyces ficellus TaxID=1977088 RepID=A0A6I6F7X5_9ACTN|nr:hypothetical protein [Streptomyces ficellus]QGV79081.1 hypothetical protein EIZ62_13060 [Streptomyces ficellus]
MRHALALATLCCAALLVGGCDDTDRSDRSGGAGGAKSGAGAGARSAPAETETGTETATAEHAATVRAAVAATGRTSARIAQTHTIDGTAIGEQVHTITVGGDFDFAKDRGNLAVTLGPVAFEEVFDGDNVYLRGQVPGDPDGDWYLADRRAPARHLLRAPANDPEYTLSQATMARTFARAGEETINGAPVVRYRGALPHEAVTLRMEKATSDKIGEMRRTLGGRIPADVDVWVDARGRAVRARLALDMGGVTSTNTLTFSELGKPVRITVPQGEITEGDLPESL